MTIKETPVPAKRGKRSIFDRAISEKDMDVMVGNPGKFYEVDSPDRPEKTWTFRDMRTFRLAATKRGFVVRSVGCTESGSLGRVWVAYDPSRTLTER